MSPDDTPAGDGHQVPTPFDYDSDPGRYRLGMRLSRSFATASLYAPSARYSSTPERGWSSTSGAGTARCAPPCRIARPCWIRDRPGWWDWTPRAGCCWTIPHPSYWPTRWPCP